MSIFAAGRKLASGGASTNSELLDELLKEYKSPEDVFGTDDPRQQFMEALVERAMKARTPPPSIPQFIDSCSFQIVSY
jgi:hypothetical protein